MLRYQISPHFQAKEALDRSRTGPVAEIISSARARARRQSQTRNLISALAFVAAPVLAYNAHWRTRTPAMSPAAPVASRQAPALIEARSAPQQPMAERIARTGVDYTATSATVVCPQANRSQDCRARAPARKKPISKKKLPIR